MGTPHPSAALGPLLLLVCAGAMAAAASAAALGHPIPVAHLQGAGIYGSEHPLDKMDGADAPPSHTPTTQMCSGAEDVSGNLTYRTVCLAEGSGNGASHKGSLDPSSFASSFAELVSSQTSDGDSTNGTPARTLALNFVDPEEGGGARSEEETPFDSDEQWGLIVSGVDEYSTDMVDYTSGLEQKATEWADKAQEWAEYTMDMHPYSTRFEACPTGLPAHTDDVSSYASALSAFASSLAVSAADVARQAGDLRSFAAAVKGLDTSPDWSLAEDYTWYTNSLGKSLSHLASWTADLASASASWHANVAFLSAQHLNSTGSACSLNDHSLFIAETAGDMAELALSWSHHARGMDSWVSGWRDYARDMELFHTGSA